MVIKKIAITEHCDDRSGNRANIPDNIQIPEYLKDYLNSLEVPHTFDYEFLSKVGKGALKAKITDAIEEYNMTVKTGRKRIPTKLNFEEIAIIMKSLFTFKNVVMTDHRNDTLLYVYDNDRKSPQYGTYVDITARIGRIMVRIAPNVKSNNKKDVIDKIERSTDMFRQTKDKHLFAVNNGIYNQKTGELLPFNHEYVYLTKIPIDYKPQPINPVITAPDGYQWDVESWIADLTKNDVDTTTLIWQVIAECLQPSYSRQKGIWFYSVKGYSGKGTIGQLIKNLLGDGNYASLAVADFKHEYLKSTLLGVAANIGDDNDVNKYIDNVRDYRSSITDGDIFIKVKHEKQFTMQFNGANIQMIKGLPKIKDKSDLFHHRLVIVPFFKWITANDERTYIKNDYIHRKEVLEYVLHKAINMDFDEFIVPQQSARLLNKYK